ncbi:NAD-dependent epimerase/dehydratase family protein [Clostridium sp. AL.422]|uniref:NAD-dependent epimerase/dehydratase family protein n=1 Tax=Clostridium TaxID=1485 RepID=UPI00293DEFE8|nr:MULTISPECIES: NAD-dependent epimerase/dehydratase family protein [unclassified Clostridium]MDV4150402.1 NAD-dependent epimerase/dehydratase family protein [Clostridium sp. AL.422]
MYINIDLYKEELESLFTANLPWEKLDNKKILITGANGLICSYLIDLLMYRNIKLNSNIKVYALGRNEERLKARFKSFFDREDFVFIKQDISKKLNVEDKVDYIIHGASNAVPAEFLKDPVGTMTGNIFGVYNLLEYSKDNNVEKLLYISSSEVYGDDLSKDSFNETDSGYVNPLDVRACYPSSKRAAETLCATYLKQYNIDFCVARPGHIYGPTYTEKDNRALCQFINNVLNNNDIIMKSEGSQIRSYCYLSDCVMGLLYMLLVGKSGEAYNISNKNSNVSIREMAETIAELSEKKVIFELPSNTEKSVFTKINKAILDSSKLESLGWEASVLPRDGISRILNIKKELKRE